MDFVPKRPMRAKQLEAFNLSKDERYFALLMRMRTGKSKVALDTACYLYTKGRINAVVILAPKGVHSKWVLSDCPADIPDYIDYTAAIWRSGNKKAASECEDLFNPGQHLRVLAVNIETLSRDNSDAEKLLVRFLNATDAMLIVDESHTIKTPESKRTKRVLKLGDKAAYKRILTGTPVANAVFDLYSQFNFLDQGIFGQSYFAFKHQYAEILPDNHPTVMAIRARGARFTPAIPAKDSKGKTIYKNLDKLKQIITPHSFTCRLEDCTDLPPTIYEKQFYELAPKQRKVYDELKAKARLEFESSSVTVLHKMTMLLRLQQIISGFLPADDQETMVHLFAKPEDNPRVSALLTLLESIEEEDEQAIIWCRFIPEIKMLEQVLGDKCFTLHGATKNREEIKNRFMAGERRYIVANVAVGGTGLDYSGIYNMIYFSNDFNFGNRDQSEARPLHVGQTRSLLIVDLEAEDTIDSHIVDAMQNKRDVSVEMMKLG
jgi:SNF2 family DNA or RNA helicase